ncbi:putative membrane protein [Proteiniphilum saccharofermentans]|uniref:Putative membrane protein n=1 Tax=Proteiniphilum saccharofermentans TaxID=1642647 RepID=A0A1R3TAT0_9BACT|nr:putative membrane protein [Proteiniphilum saccharofermentans]
MKTMDTKIVFGTIMMLALFTTTYAQTLDKAKLGIPSSNVTIGCRITYLKYAITEFTDSQKENTGKKSCRLFTFILNDYFCCLLSMAR